MPAGRADDACATQSVVDDGHRRKATVARMEGERFKTKSRAQATRDVANDVGRGGSLEWA